MGDISNPQNALGAPDSDTTELGQGAILQLLVGSSVFDGEGIDLVFEGEVSTPSSVQLNTWSCPTGFPNGPSFRVDASNDGSDWKLLGYWTQTVQGGSGSAQGFGFNLSCAKLKSALFFRITALDAAARATFNSLTAVNCAGSPTQ